MRGTVFLLCLFCTVAATGQNAARKIDSLLQVAAKADDSTKFRIYNRVGFYYIFNELPKAQELLKEGILQAQMAKMPFCEAELTNTYGIYYDVSGKADSARFYFEKALDISQKHNYKTITIMVVNNLGMFHWNKGNYQEALSFFFHALEMNKDHISTSGDGTYLNNIGLIYQEMGQHHKALQYHREALEIRKQFNVPEEIAISLSNIAVVLGSMGDYTGAEKIFQEAIATAKAANELGKYYDALNGLSDIYLEQNQPQKAIPLLTELLAGREKNNIERRSNLETISHLIKAHNLMGNLPEALRYVKDGNSFLVEFPSLKNATVDFYRNASETYFRTGNPAMGSEFLQKSLDVKQEIFSSENARAIADMETRFKVAENESNLAQARANLAESNLELEKKNVVILGSVLLTLFVLFLGYFFYRQQKLRNKQLEREAELKAALAKIETQNKLQEQRLQISRDLHDNIGAQLTFIISSLDVTKFGMRDKIPKLGNKLEKISEFASQTIFELRDTIWAMNKMDISLEDLQIRISNFIEKAREVCEVDFHFEIDSDIKTKYSFTSVEGMNIYRIIQEGVNNALKHAGASEIAVHISDFSAEGEHALKIAIRDNGKGFGVEQTEPGNGLANMRKRANELHATLNIISAEKEGTQVVLLVPVATFHSEEEAV